MNDREARAAMIAREAFKARVLAWVTEQETQRSGPSSWAKAQRSMLKNLRTFLARSGEQA